MINRNKEQPVYRDIDFFGYYNCMCVLLKNEIVKLLLLLAIFKIHELRGLRVCTKFAVWPLSTPIATGVCRKYFGLNQFCGR